MIRHKFYNKPTVIDGRRYSSKKEAKYAQDLSLAMKSGELLFYLWQAPFHLRSGLRYIVDFVEFWRDGTVRFVDIKGFKTTVYLMKKRLVEAEYPIEIIEG